MSDPLLPLEGPMLSTQVGLIQGGWLLRMGEKWQTPGYYHGTLFSSLFPPPYVKFVHGKIFLRNILYLVLTLDEKKNVVLSEPKNGFFFSKFTFMQD
jgi:hypothetical protein